MTTRYRLLSYALSPDTPAYGDTKPLRLKARKQIKAGNSCNTFEVSFENHLGTHIDCPRHFFDDGTPLAKFNVNDFVFKKPYIIDCSKKANEMISVKDINKIPKKSDMLIMKTGFYKKRKNMDYRRQNPGFSKEAAEWIRLNRPLLRAIGIDCISISAFKNRGVGREVHRILLDEKRVSGKAIFLVEDMDLSANLTGLSKIYAFPFFIERVDSAPCTILGEFN